MPKALVCTMYVVQHWDAIAKKQRPEYLHEDTVSWVTFAQCHKYDRRKDALADGRNFYGVGKYRIVPVRVTPLSATSKRSKHRTG